MNTSPHFKWGIEFADKINLSGQKQVLDIGCRKGFISQHIAKTNPYAHFTAIDNVASEIEYAQSQSALNLNFSQGNILHLDQHECFDTIVSFNCLLWVQKKYQALENIFKALKPGKKFYSQLFILHDRPKNDRFIYHIANLPKWKNYFKDFSPTYFETTFAQFSAMLQSIGFIIHRMEFVNYPIVFSHPDELHGFLKTWASHPQKLPLQKRNYFLAEVVDLYLNSHKIKKNETIPYQEYFLEIECEKPLNYQNLRYAKKSLNFQYQNVAFTQREARVLKYYFLGNTANEISNYLHISAKTVEFHLNNIKEKLQVKHRSEIYQSGIDLGFIHLMFNPSL